jgi:hypothetical protein
METNKLQGSFYNCAEICVKAWEVDGSSRGVDSQFVKISLRFWTPTALCCNSVKSKNNKD